MNRRIEFLLGGFAVLIVLAIFTLGRTSEASRVKAEVNHQADLWNSGDGDGLYATLTVNAQRACPLEVLKSLAWSATPGAGAEVALENMAVRVQGGRAFVTGFVTVGGGLVWRIDDTDPAVYVKTESGWKFDSMGKVGDACRMAGSMG